jgi:hypothetical protein
VEDYQTVVLAAGAAIIVIVAAAIVVAVIRRRRRAQAMQAPLPLIPFSAGHGRGFGPPRPDRTFRSPAPNAFDRPTAQTPAWSAPVGDRVARTHQESPYAPPPQGNPLGGTPPVHGPSSSPLAATAQPNDAVGGAAVDGALMRYWRPADGTLQFLPGRLEVVAGRDAGHEIRFVRTPGPDGTRVTFGRAEGAPYRHIQLREPTVSRTHARMTLEVTNRNGGDASTSTARWRLENLSATNPVVVNGTPLAADDSEKCSVMLDDGDRIEMGEVVFRFRER